MIKLPNKRKHLGITLIEVVFAIGVILIGLVGLTSILPLAGHRAQDSLDFDTGAAMTDAVGSEVEARGILHEPSVATLPTAPLTIPNATIIPVEGGTIRLSTAIVIPFCFDPIFGAMPPTAVANSYTPNLFPFFADNHNPFLDPAKAASTGTAAFASQPRMLRVKLNPNLISPVPSADQQLEIARALAESIDDLAQVRPGDRSKPSVLTGLTAVATGLPFGKSIPTGTYSWMVTVDPDSTADPSQAPASASMSVVVFRGRERFDLFPTITAVGEKTDPRKNAVAERTALVVERTGFSGGAGGTVRLMSSAETLSNLISNDWIMLSRNTGGGSEERLAVHRWYRVVSTDREAELITSPADTTITSSSGTVTVPVATLAGAGTEVWARNVLLDGPDWNFTNDATGNWFTYATIVKDVVSVKTTTISLAGF